MIRLSDPVAIAPVAATLGEGPIWVERDGALWWLDIKGQAIFRWRGGETDRFATPCRIGSLAPMAAGGFVAGTELGFMRVEPEVGRYETIGNPEADLPYNRFNDGKVDRTGRFWAGTMDDREEDATGSLWRLDPDLGWTCADTGYRVTNGPAFSPDGRTMYHNDSARQHTYAFDLAADGTSSNRRELLRFDERQGYPDGMTVDADGCLWIAFWDGWCVRRFSPDGEQLQEARLPVARPTSCAFGGAGMDRLFVTSARVGLTESDLAVQPLAGALFMLETSVRGIPERPFG